MARVVVLGSSNTDLTVRLPRLPEPGQTCLGGSLLRGPGGKGANQAVAAARAGAEVVFITAVGDDAFGTGSLEHYWREQIDTRHARIVAGVASGVALIFVGDDGENMIGVAPGANSSLSPGDVEGLPDDVFTAGGLFLVAGLEVPVATVAAAIRRASKAGMTVVVNPAPAPGFISEFDGFGLIDVITPNRSELGSLTRLKTDDPAHLERAARALYDVGPRSVIVTLSAEGCLVLHQGEIRRIPSHAVRAVDTVGAGDAFNGALAVALAEGRDLRAAAAWANAAAALAVTVPGAQTAIPYREDIDRWAARPFA
jgi:ribokinase